MIKRLTDPKEFEKAVRDIFDLFDLENEQYAHHFLKHDKEGKKEFKYITMGATMRHPDHKKVIRFYKKMGFLKDSEAYIARLWTKKYQKN
mgnify:CR=1 FL=1